MMPEERGCSLGFGGGGADARTPDPREQQQVLPDSHQQQPEKKKENKEQEKWGVIPFVAFHHHPQQGSIHMGGFVPEAFV